MASQQKSDEREGSFVQITQPPWAGQQDGWGRGQPQSEPEPEADREALAGHKGLGGGVGHL